MRHRESHLLCSVWRGLDLVWGVEEGTEKQRGWCVRFFISSSFLFSTKTLSSLARHPFPPFQAIFSLDDRRPGVAAAPPFFLRAPPFFPPYHKI